MLSLPQQALRIAKRLQARLGFDYAYANTLGITDDKLNGLVIGEIINPAAKAQALREVCAQLKLDPTRAIAIGDGANDLKMMAAAGLSVAFRAKPRVREAASASLNFVGLEGALRLFE